MNSKKKLIKEIKNNKNWIIPKELFFEKISNIHKYKFEKGRVELKSKDKSFKITIELINEKNNTGWRIRFFTFNNMGLPIFQEEIADSYRYLLHLINFFFECVVSWTILKDGFISDSSELYIPFKSYLITFENNFLIYLDTKTRKEIKRIDLGANIVKIRNLPGKGILVLLDNIPHKYFYNLYLLDYNGKKKWKAEYTKNRINKGFSTIIVKEKKGYFFKRYRIFTNSLDFYCGINPRNGRIISKRFVK